MFKWYVKVISIVDGCNAICRHIACLMPNGVMHIPMNGGTSFPYRFLVNINDCNDLSPSIWNFKRLSRPIGRGGKHVEFICFV